MKHVLAVLGLAAVVCGPLLFYRLGDHDLWASHEARAAQDGQRLLDDGDWLTPRLFDDQIELQKPPLYYWLVAVAGRLRGGVDAVAVRLPAALAGVATVLLVYGFLAANGRPLAGGLAAFVLATAQHFTSVARTGRIDVPLTMTVTAAMCCLWTSRRSERSAVALAMFGYVAIAAGVLLKGPLGLILPLAILLADGVVGRRSAGEPILPRSLAWGLPLVCALVAPWFAIAHLRTHGEFTRVFFWYHNVQRATGGAAALGTHPWWFYGPRLMVDFLPWSPVLLIAAYSTIRSRGMSHNQLAALGLTWLVVVVGLLSASRFKRADYLLPAYPGAALWLGCVGERLFARWQSPWRARWLAAGLGGAAAAVIAAWVAYLHVSVPDLDADREKHTFAAAVRQVAPRPEQILLFRVEDHLLSFHLGRPINTFLEWENLDVWVGRPGTHHVLMPAECAAAWRQYISSGTLDEVLRYTDRTDRRRPRDLVLMRTRPRRPEETDPADGPVDRATEGQQGAGQRAVAGVQPGGRAGTDR